MSDNTPPRQGSADDHMPGAETPGPRGDLPAVQLDDHLRTLRDHLVGAFPDLQVLAHRGELTLVSPTGQILDVLAFCKDDPALSCELLSDLSAVHWPAGVIEEDVEETTGWPTHTMTRDDGIIEVDYILRSITHHHVFRVRVTVPDTAPVVPSATGLYSSANFMEREAFDLMGVEFTGHPQLNRIMMPEDWDGHPHRKDYPLGGVEVMYKGQTVPPPDERDY